MDSPSESNFPENKILKVLQWLLSYIRNLHILLIKNGSKPLTAWETDVIRRRYADLKDKPNAGVSEMALLGIWLYLDCTEKLTLNV